MNRIVHLSLFLCGSLVGGVIGMYAIHPQAGTDESVRGEIEILTPANHADPGLEESDRAALATAELERSERRAAAILAAAAREDVDLRWAPDAELRIADGVTTHGPPGSRLVLATCKTTLCVVEIEYRAGDDGPDRLDWPAILGLARGFVVHHEPAADGNRRIMAYLARDEYSLPGGP